MPDERPFGDVDDDADLLRPSWPATLRTEPRARGRRCHLAAQTRSDQANAVARPRHLFCPAPLYWPACSSAPVRRDRRCSPGSMPAPPRRPMRCAAACAPAWRPAAEATPAGSSPTPAGPPARSLPHRAASLTCQHRTRRGRPRCARPPPAQTFSRCPLHRPNRTGARSAVRRGHGRRRPRHRRRAQPRPPCSAGCPAAAARRANPGVRYAAPAPRRPGTGTIGAPRHARSRCALTAWWTADASRARFRSRGAMAARAEGEREQGKKCRRASPARRGAAAAQDVDGGRPHRRRPRPAACLRCSRRYLVGIAEGTGAQRLPARSRARLSGRRVCRVTRCPGLRSGALFASPAARPARRLAARLPSCTSWRRTRADEFTAQLKLDHGWRQPPSRAGRSSAGGDKRSPRLPDATL